MLENYRHSWGMANAFKLKGADLLPQKFTKGA
jgi:hypothetical protein